MEEKNTIIIDGTITLTYTGGIYDGVTGLYYLNACYYNPVEAWELLKKRKAKNKRYERLIKAVILIYNGKKEGYNHNGIVKL